MAFPARVCAFIGRFADPRVQESLALLLPHLAASGVEVLVSEELPASPGGARATLVDEQTLAERADLVIAIGGDGTLLYAARLVARRGSAAARDQSRPARFSDRRDATGCAQWRR